MNETRKIHETIHFEVHVMALSPIESEKEGKRSYALPILHRSLFLPSVNIRIGLDLYVHIGQRSPLRTRNKDNTHGSIAWHIDQGAAARSTCSSGLQLAQKALERDSNDERARKRERMVIGNSLSNNAVINVIVLIL